MNRWACEVDITYCIESMKRSFHNLVENGTLIKSQRTEDELHIVFCNAVKYGDRLEYSVIERSIQTGDLEYNRLLVEAMGCSRDQNFLQNYFNLIFNETFYQYVPNIINAAAGNKIGKFILLEMLFNRFDDIVGVVGLERIIPLFESITTEFELKLVSEIANKPYYLVSSFFICHSFSYSSQFLNFLDQK